MSLVPLRGLSLLRAAFLDVVAAASRRKLSFVGDGVLKLFWRSIVLGGVSVNNISWDEGRGGVWNGSATFGSTLFTLSWAFSI